MSCHTYFTTETRRNAIEFLNAYQSRHTNRPDRTYVCIEQFNAYWKWRSEWITLCLKQSGDWGKGQSTFTRSDIGLIAVGRHHVPAAHSLF